MLHPIWRPSGRAAVALAAALLCASAAQAGLFDDEEARKAILDLRARIQAIDDAGRKAATDGAAANTQMVEQLTAMRRSLLELNNQLEAMRGELAKLRGDGEQMARDLATLQRTQKDANQNFDERLRKIEPQKVALDGREFTADPAEKRAYDDAMATIREGNFDAAAGSLTSFLGKYPTSGYSPTARFWLGNALYGKRDYKGAIAAFRALVTDAPEHARAPEALLAVANSQAEMKDPRAARRTIDELLKAYPQSEAAAAGKERLAALK